MAENTISILKPSVNNLTVRTFVRAASTCFLVATAITSQVIGTDVDVGPLKLPTPQPATPCALVPPRTGSRRAFAATGRGPR